MSHWAIKNPFSLSLSLNCLLTLFNFISARTCHKFLFYTLYTSPLYFFFLSFFHVSIDINNIHHCSFRRFLFVKFLFLSFNSCTHFCYFRCSQGNFIIFLPCISTISLLPFLFPSYIAVVASFPLISIRSLFFVLLLSFFLQILPPPPMIPAIPPLLQGREGGYPPYRMLHTGLSLRTVTWDFVLPLNTLREYNPQPRGVALGREGGCVRTELTREQNFGRRTQKCPLKLFATGKTGDRILLRFVKKRAVKGQQFFWPKFYFM
jgi:hypothetical protein